MMRDDVKVRSRAAGAADPQPEASQRLWCHTLRSGTEARLAELSEILRADAQKHHVCVCVCALPECAGGGQSLAPAANIATDEGAVASIIRILGAMAD